MRALITGVAGFVGSAIARRLLSEGHDVVGIDVMSDYYDVQIKRANLRRLEGPQFTFYQEDINTADLDLMLTGVDKVFHQAGQPGVRKSWGDDFVIYTRANIDATQRLLEAVSRAKGVTRLVYASSSSLYGNAERYPTSEDDRPQPLSPYGVSKLAAEHLCSLYGANFGVPTTSLRYFTVYGPGQRTDMAFTRFVKAAVTHGEIQIYGTGEQIRDFTFVDDVVEANVLAAFSDDEPGVVYNVAGGSNTSVNEVIALISDLNGEDLRVSYSSPVAGDVWRTGGDTTKIRNALDWKANVSLREGLVRQLQWARETFTSS